MEIFRSLSATLLALIVVPVFYDLTNDIVALPIEDRGRNLTKSILARVCTLNVCGYSTLLRSVQ